MEPWDAVDPTIITITLQAPFDALLESNASGLLPPSDGPDAVVQGRVGSLIPLTASLGGIPPSAIFGTEAAAEIGVYASGICPDYLAMHLHETAALMAQPEVAARLPEAVTQAVGGLLCDAKQIPGLSKMCGHSAGDALDNAWYRPLWKHAAVGAAVSQGLGVAAHFRTNYSERPFIGYNTEGEFTSTLLVSFLFTTLAGLVMSHLLSVEATAPLASSLDFVPYLEAIDVLLQNSALLLAAGVSPENLEMVRLALHLRALIISLNACMAAAMRHPPFKDVLNGSPPPPDPIPFEVPGDDGLRPPPPPSADFVPVPEDNPLSALLDDVASSL